MKEPITWRDAERAAATLDDRNRRTLLLLARLPLLWERVIAQLSGLRAGSAYESLAELKTAGLLAALDTGIRPGRSPAQLYLTDLGLATVALDQGVDPQHVARANRLSGSDLLELLPGLPQLNATYELLGALAASRPAQPNLLAWQRPWRNRYQRPSAKAPVTVRLPAYAALAWGDEAGDYFLIPDLSTFPLRVYRSTLGHLLVVRATQDRSLPHLVVATEGARRATAWTRLIEEAGRVRREAPLAATITTWSQLRGNAEGPIVPGGDVRRPRLDLVERIRLRPLGAEEPDRPIPGLVGDSLAPGATLPSVAHGPGRVALCLSAADRVLLDLVGRHPFLSLRSLAQALDWTPKWARQRRNRLLRLGLMRRVGAEEVEPRAAKLELYELTANGLALLAAQQGLSLPVAVRMNGLAGGGPRQPIGSRGNLLRNLQHTLGADSLFTGLLHTARRIASTGGDDRLLEWQNAAMCARRFVRPDGYGIYRRNGALYGFFLEYDRGTMSARDYRDKFTAYYEYRASGQYELDYEGFPTILVVVTENAVEERIARVIRAIGVGRSHVLPVLLTSEWRISGDGGNPDGMLGPIWREPAADFDDRRYWPLLTRGACGDGAGSPGPWEMRSHPPIPLRLPQRPSPGRADLDQDELLDAMVCPPPEPVHGEARHADDLASRTPDFQSGAGS